MQKTQARSLPDLVSLAERVGMALSRDREPRQNADVLLTGSISDISDNGSVT
jgi:hypothetical protein